MMVVDSSAVVAIFRAEDDAQPLADAMAAADQLVMSAVNAHETAMILRARGGPESAEDFWGFLSVNGIEVAPSMRTRRAGPQKPSAGSARAFTRKPDLADCAAYALAKSLSAPLLFKG